MGVVVAQYKYDGLRAQIHKLPAHKSMLDIAEIIFQTCKTYLLQQGKFLLMLFALISVAITYYLLAFQEPHKAGEPEAFNPYVKVALVQLPGVNTPQFDWVRTRLRRHPQPVPPIYQPEVAARAIAWAAEHPRRELWVGLPTVYTILGERVASGLMDRYLAKTNIKAQQSEQPIDPVQRRDNLFAPPPGDPGSHGAFDDKAKPRSPQLWLTTHKRPLAAAAAALVGAAALTALRP